MQMLSAAVLCGIFVNAELKLVFVFCIVCFGAFFFNFFARLQITQRLEKPVLGMAASEFFLATGTRFCVESRFALFPQFEPSVRKVWYCLLYSVLVKTGNYIKQ